MHYLTIQHYSSRFANEISAFTAVVAQQLLKRGTHFRDVIFYKLLPQFFLLDKGRKGCVVDTMTTLISLSLSLSHPITCASPGGVKCILAASTKKSL
jgi:hypothetical protein